MSGPKGIKKFAVDNPIRLSWLSTVEAVAIVVWKRTFKLESCFPAILPPEVARRTAIALMVG